jgi:hypothetical protein
VLASPLQPLPLVSHCCPCLPICTERCCRATASWPAAAALHDRRRHDIAYGDHICLAASAPDLVRAPQSSTTSSSTATTTTCTAASASNSSAAAAAVAADAVRNQALNSIGNTGHGTASTGSAVSTNAETMIPLSAVTHFGAGNIPLAVNHQGLTVATTISFNLAPGAALSDAVQAVNEVMARLGVPPSIHGTFQGTARAFQESVVNEPYLILAALTAVCRSRPCCTTGSRWCGREATGPPCIFRRPEHRSWIPE